MKVVISTHNGVINPPDFNFEADVTSINVATDNVGEFGILKQFVPTICVFNNGYVNIKKADGEVYVVLKDALVEFNNDVLTILAKEASMALTLAEALASFKATIRERIEENKQLNVDFSLKEKELKDNIKKSRAHE